MPAKPTAQHPKISRKSSKVEHAPAPKPVPREGRDADGNVYGVEGTNKTLPVPLEDAEASPELQGIKSTYIPKSPYTRG